MAVTPKVIVANPGGVTSVTDGAVGYPITTGSYTTATTVDGVPYLIAPNGVQISATTPAFTTSPRAKNGAMINPQNLDTGGTGRKQPFDIGGGALGSFADTYDAASLADPATVLRPNDCIVKAVGVTTIDAQGREGTFSQWSGLHVRASAAPAGTFAAPFIWPSDDVANRPWRVVDVDARLAELPSYSSAGQNVVSWAALSSYHDALDLGRAIAHINTLGSGYEGFTRFGSTAINNYGRELARMQAIQLIGLMSDAWSTGDKTDAFIRLLQNGCQFGEAVVKHGVAASPDSGHDRATYAPGMAWLWATGRQSEYATWMSMISGNSGPSMYYQLTTALIASDFVPHSDPLKPYPYRRRSVLAVTNGGLTVDMEGFVPNGGITEDTASNGWFTELDLVKESNGNSATVTATEQIGSYPTAYWRLTLAAPLTGLAVSDVVYCRAQYTLTDGMAEWYTIARPSIRNPSPSAPYRNLNRPCAGRMFARAIGMVGSDMAIPEAYLERAMAGTNGMPTQAETNPVGTASPSWVTQFYTANWATLKALPQDV